MFRFRSEKVDVQGHFETNFVACCSLGSRILPKELEAPPPPPPNTADTSPFGSTGKPKPATVQEKTKLNRSCRSYWNFMRFESMVSVDFHINRGKRGFCGFRLLAFLWQTLDSQMHGRRSILEAGLWLFDCGFHLQGTVAGIILRQPATTFNEKHQM